jgi:ABC-type multidrug transport system fused ATPase/permease subunit
MLRKFLKKNTIARAFQVLDQVERRKILSVAIAQTFLGFLDLLGVVLVGLIGSMAVTGIQSKEPSSSIQKVLDFLQISAFSFQLQVALLGCIAAVALIGRSLLTMFISKKILYFLSYKAASISSRLIGELLSRNISQINRRSSQETLFAVTNGVQALLLNVAGTSIGVFADVFLMILLSVGLFVFDPIMAIGTFVLFGLVAMILYFLTQRKVSKLGEQISLTSVVSNVKILEVVHAFREIYVHDRQSYYADEISKTRYKLADSNAELSFVPSISKYVIEITMVAGAILLSSVQFLLHDSDQAIATLAVFIASASRIAPAILRLQTGLIAIKSNIGVANLTLEMIDFFSPLGRRSYISTAFKCEYPGFNPSVMVNNASFTYEGNARRTVEELSLRVEPGQLIAFVGSSGAGKSTLIDLILGLRNPEEGEIFIGGLSPREALKKWPGAVSYVPQQVHISDSTILENVAFGFEFPEISLAWEALEIAQLAELVNSLPLGINTRVGENGSMLSGGERQRLGIARALYTKPKLLVLDEATSSLDSQTELHISSAIKKLRGDVTMLIVAHRLSSVVDADNVIFLRDGRIIANGDFEKVKAVVPDFEEQARLMGL